MQRKIPIICVVGPTASGKTALAARLAKYFGGEVISSDSIQIYDGMDIATAKPTLDEMMGIPHYMIGFLPPQCDYSVAEYTSLAAKIIRHINRRDKITVVAGGTGLYIDSLLNNIKFCDVSPDIELRQTLRIIAEEKGSEYLHDMLKKYDLTAAKKISANDVVRIIRAIEAYKISGKTAAQRESESKSVPSEYSTFYIGLDFRDRQRLYDRINARVDVMIEMGLINEARNFLNCQISKTAMNAIGYKELQPFILGESSLDECIEKIKMDTRRYAKRQLTWFRRNKAVNWIDVQDKSDEDIFNEAKRILETGNF